MIKLKDLLFEGVYDKGIFKAVFMAGGPGSGKSYVVQKLFGIPEKINISVSGLKTVSSDAEFETLLKKYGFDPKYLDQYRDDLFQDLTVKGKSGAREFAKSLTKARQKGYMDGKLGMIIDGTGHNYQKIKKEKGRLEKEGYDAYMVFVNTSLDVAQERNKKRSRVLPEKVVSDSWHDVQRNIGGFQSLFGNNFVIVDNSDTLDEDKAVKKFGRYVKSHADKWAKEPIKNPIGKAWVKDQIKLKNAGIK